MDHKFQIRILGPKENLTIGEDLKIAREPWPFFDLKAGLEIGNHVVISEGVYILTHSHQFGKKNWLYLREVVPPNSTIIEDYVFIGINAIITSTCKRIGRHSVVGAGAVVTKDIPDCEIWAGNPATKIADVT